MWSLAYFSNSRLGWNGEPGPNTLAYSLRRRKKTGFKPSNEDRQRRVRREGAREPDGEDHRNGQDRVGDNGVKHFFFVDYLGTK